MGNLKLHYCVIDAFTGRAFTGNPAAVVMIDEYRSDAWMLKCHGWFWLPNGTRWYFDLGQGGTPMRMRAVQPDGDTVLYSYAGPQPWTHRPGSRGLGGPLPERRDRHDVRGPGRARHARG